MKFDLRCAVVSENDRMPDDAKTVSSRYVELHTGSHGGDFQAETFRVGIAPKVVVGRIQTGGFESDPLGVASSDAVEPQGTPSEQLPARARYLHRVMESGNDASIHISP